MRDVDDARKQRIKRFVCLVLVVIVLVIVWGYISSHRAIISPVPEDSGIQIIYLSPTPSGGMRVLPSVTSTPIP